MKIESTDDDNNNSLLFGGNEEVEENKKNYIGKNVTDLNIVVCWLSLMEIWQL
jgi:hypothetical protein